MMTIEQLPLADTRRPTRAVVDLAAFRANLNHVQTLVGPRRKIVAVVKANAYGHGMVDLAREAHRWGAAMLGVATVDEALELRETKGLESADVLLLGPSFVEDAEHLQRANISVAVGSHALLDAHLAAARKLSRAARLHLKFDTGMGRYGFAHDDLAPLDRVGASNLEGLMTHFCVSDESDADNIAYTKMQRDRFAAIVAAARARGLKATAHSCNSGGVLHHADSHLDMVRPGVMLYGSNPDPNGAVLPLRQVMTLATRIVSIHDHRRGEAISYGRKYTMPADGRVAILPIGYGDGFPRSLTGKGSVLVQGRKIPIAGRVCMDQTMIDVTQYPDVRLGDEVVLYGSQGDERISLEEVARLAGTITYEITCQLGRRVPRTVVDTGAAS